MLEYKGDDPMNLADETDLHVLVSRFIQKHYNNRIVQVGMGEYLITRGKDVMHIRKATSQARRTSQLM